MSPQGPPLYVPHAPTEAQRLEIRSALPEIDDLAPELAEITISAWASSWLSSPYERFLEIPMAIPAPRYALVQHTRDVVLAGLALLDVAATRLGRPADHDTVLAAMLLHDLDSPLIYVREGDGLVYSERGRLLQHGVLGAMILRDLGAPETVLSLVATHALDSPLHHESPEAWVLYYADLFAADHALMASGTKPVFCRK